MWLVVGRCSPCAKDLVATCKSGRSCAKYAARIATDLYWVASSSLRKTAASLRSSTDPLASGVLTLAPQGPSPSKSITNSA